MTNRRESLVDAAAELLDQGGPAAVTLREVGAAAGVSHNAPYKHFENKDDLLAAIAGRELERLSDKAERAGTRKVSIRTMMLDYVRWALAYPNRFKLVAGAWTQVSPELGKGATRWKTLLIRSVEVAQNEGILPAGESERVSWLVLAVAHGAADLAIAGHLSPNGKGKASPEDLLSDLLGHLKKLPSNKPRSQPKVHVTK